MKKQDILSAILRVVGSTSEGERDVAVEDLIDSAPHARLSDLIYYSERDRNYEEIAEEALLRERIWTERGEEALQAHIEAQLRAAIADPSLPEQHYHKVSARMLLNSIRPRNR